METPDPGEDDPSTSGSRPTLSASDPYVFAKLVEELKSQGIFDDIRKECSAELDTKSSYDNMQNRVQTSVYNFLYKQNANWNPTLNKPQFRNLLRKYLHNEQYMDSGVERIVDETDNPKIYSNFEPLVETVVIQCLGRNQSDGTVNASNDFQNGKSTSGANFIARPQTGSPSRMSSISSDDIEMQVVDSEGDGNRGVVSDGSSPGPAMRGNISPLTPDRAGTISNITNQTRTEDEVSDIEMNAKQLRGDISPLTPSPREPKEDDEDDDEEEEKDAGRSSPPRVARTERPTDSEDQEMSPVSNTEFGDVSPASQTHDTPDGASLTPPPLPPSQMPQPDFEEGTPMPPLPPPLSSDEALMPPLPPKSKHQATTLYESDEGEVHSEDEGHVKAGDPTKPAEDPSSISPVSDDMSDVQEDEAAQVEETEELPLTPGQPEEVPEEVHEAETAGKTEVEEEKSDAEEEPKIEPKDRKSEVDDRVGGAQGGGSGPGPYHFESAGGSDSNHKKKDERETQRRNSSSDKGKERRSSHHRHHSSSSKDGHHHRRHSSSSSKHKRDKDRDRKRDDRKQDETSDPKEKKEKAKEREMKREKERIKFEKIESKISKSFTIKSAKYQAIDMFAPKNKPKLGPIISVVSPRTSLSALSPKISTPIAAKSPPIFATMTIPSSSTPNPSNPSTPTTQMTSKPVKEPESSSKHSKSDRHQDYKTDKSKNNKNSSEHHREVALSATSPIFERRILPELPVSKCDGDKQKQHMNDFEDTKRRLEEARQRRQETKKKEQEAKKKMKQNSETKTPKSESSKSGKIKDRRRSSSDVHSSKHRPKKMEISGSDTSEDEWHRNSSKKRDVEKSSTDRKKKKKIEKRRFSDSSSGEEEPVPEVKEAPVMTRKLAHKTEADKVFNQDPSIPTLYGFEAKERQRIQFEIDEAELSDSSDIEDLIPLIPNKVIDNSLIYINNLASPEKDLQILKAFGGKPKLVRSIPSWLESKLEHWSLKRQDVDIIYPDEIQKIRNKRKILTEKEFEIRLGIYQSPEKQQQQEQQPNSMQIEDILMEQMPDIVTNSDDTLDTTNEVMAKGLIDKTPLKRQKKVPAKKAKSAETVNGSQPQKDTGDSPLAKKSKTKRASKKSSVGMSLSENVTVEETTAVEPIKNPSVVVHESGPEDESDEIAVSKSNEGEELFHGFKKVSTRKPRNEIKLESIDVHGCSFGMSDDISETETETLKNKFEVLINQNFFDHAAKLLKGNIISELKKFKVDEPVVTNDHFGFCEVDDEFLSDDIIIPSPDKVQKLQPKPRTPRTKMKKTETDDGGGFPLPPSPVSSPSDGLVDAAGDVNPSMTSDQLTAFHNAVSILFCKMGSEALSIYDIRQHVLTTTSLSESVMMACIKDMTREQKMLQSANYFCLIHR